MFKAVIEEGAALWRARGLLRMMVRRELAARHAGSAIGIGWLYLQPILTMAAYYLVFDVVFAMRLGEGAPTRAVGAFLIVGMLPWIAFCDSINRGMNSLVEAGGLLQKNPLPAVLFPARAVLTSMVIHLPLFALLAIVYAPLHRFSTALGYVPLLMLAQAAVSLAIAYVLAILAAALRDTLQVAGFALSIGVFASPVLFPASLFPEGARALLWLNPMTPVVMGYQSVLLQGVPPDGVVWLGAVAWLLFSVLLLDRLVVRSRDQLVDWL